MWKSHGGSCQSGFSMKPERRPGLVAAIFQAAIAYHPSEGEGFTKWPIKSLPVPKPSIETTFPFWK
jgi:hypothetical protein